MGNLRRGSAISHALFLPLFLIILWGVVWGIERGHADDSLEYKLARINAGSFIPDDHITVARFRSLLGQLTTTYADTRQQIADISVKTQELLRKEGIQESLLTIMEGMNQIFTTPIKNQRYVEYSAAYLTLRQKGDSHAVAIRGLQGILRGIGAQP